MTSAEIEYGATEVVKGLFAACTSLTYVKIPETVTKIGNGSFGNTPALHEFDIPPSITEIEGLAFSPAGLTTIDIPATVTSIGNRAFNFCTLLSRATVHGVREFEDPIFTFVGSAPTNLPKTPALTDIAFPDMTKEQVWALQQNAKIVYAQSARVTEDLTITFHCSDGDFTATGREDWTATGV